MKKIKNKRFIEMDEDVEKVLNLMLDNHIPAEKLVFVAESVAKLAPLLWGHYLEESIRWDKDHLYPWAIHFNRWE